MRSRLLGAGRVLWRQQRLVTVHDLCMVCTRAQVALGLMKACEAQLFELREMEEMVEFMKNEVPNWEPSLLQVPGGKLHEPGP